MKSQHRAVVAAKDGFFDREIVPVPLASGITMTEDDGPRAGTTLEKLAALQPVFRKTAGSPRGTPARSTTAPRPSW